jgi:hypothetical protein
MDRPEDRLRAIQEQAFEQLFDVKFWFRCKYNLPPTDPRYLNASIEEMQIDYFAHQFVERYAKLKHDGKEKITIDDLIAEESFDRELAALDQRLEEEDGAVVLRRKEDKVINFSAPDPQDDG